MTVGRILVADDDDVMRTGIVMTIRSCYAHDIDAVENGADLVAKAKAASYDIIFTDNSMPKITGLQAIKEIRKFSGVPIYLVSANELEVAAAAAGANGYVNKVDVYERIGEILQKHLG